MKVFVITAPDSAGTSLITKLESEGFTVVHSLYNWKNEKGRAMFSLFEGRVKPSFSVPTDYLALEGSDVVVVDLECEAALVAEYTALAVHFGKRIIGTFGVSPQPSKFSSWCEVITHVSRITKHLVPRPVLTFAEIVRVMAAMCEDAATAEYIRSYPKSVWGFVTTGSALLPDADENVQKSITKAYESHPIRCLIASCDIA